MIDLILDDCMNVMKKYDDNHFDLAIVDPPYGLGMDGNNNWSGSKHKIKNWDNKSPNKKYFNELIRISKNQIIWGANHFISKIPYDSSCWIVWDKKNDGFSFADGEMAWTSFDKAVRFFRFHRSEQKGKRIHPTQKPVKLYQWLLHNYSEKGQKILDTHLGSGSIAIACHYFGVDLVGVEIDEEYYNKAKHRINELTAQESLF